MATAILLTLGQAAQELHCQTWHISELIRQGLYPELPRVGRFRVLRPDELPELKRLLIKKGFIGK